MRVCIAEKPSVAKEIASILGASNKKDGYFEGNGYQVTWTFGHLCTLKEPNDYDPAWKSWNLDGLPILPLKFDIKLISNKGVEKQFRTISHLVNKADEVINCGDAGQEGELIQRWVLQKAKCTKPVKRLWISSLTEEAIKEGFKQLKDASQFDRLFHAGSSRAIGDWLLGMNATRLYTLKFGNGKQVLSIGRVQTPTLALIVKRHFEILNFRPETFWELKTKYRNVLFSSEKSKYSKKEEAGDILAEIKGEPFVVTGVETKKGKETAPRLFDLTSLQVECNKRFGSSADDTLKNVQSLYEKKVVTYPRVDTTYLSSDIYPKVPGILKGLRNYANLTAPLLTKPIKKSAKVFDDSKVTDHHAIIPTGVHASGLSDREFQVYDMIVRRFIAAFYPDCEVSNTTVTGEVKKYKFKATGKQILDPGWRVVFQKEKEKEKEKEKDNEEEDENNQVLPEFVKGESGPHEPLLQEKQTQPPKPYTEATLLRAMETAGKQVEDEELRDLMKDNGIGRPSTRAAVIETLFKREYIRKEKKNLIPTTTGIGLINTINNELLKSVELTGQWEYKLRQIEKGNFQAGTFLQEMKKMVSDLVMQVKQEKNKSISATPPTNMSVKSQDLIYCPKCKTGNIIKGKTALGCNRFKEGCNFVVHFVQFDKILNEEEVLNLIKKGKSGKLKLNIDGEEQSGNLKFNEEFRVIFEPAVAKETNKEEKQLDCPKCKQGVIIKGNSAFGCTNWKNGCNFRLPFVFMEKELTDKHIEQLVLKGKTGKIKGLVLNGNTTEAAIQLGKDFILTIK